MLKRRRIPGGPDPLLDTIVGDGDDEVLTGTESSDLIQGLGGADSLLGLGGKDRLEGGGQPDTLVGGRGRDTLIGGAGDDLFRFESAKDSRPGQADVITLFRKGDALDLSAIDAVKGTAGNQDFVNVAALTGVAGQLAFSSDGGDGTIVEGDVDGDAIADIRIEISRDDRDTLRGGAGSDTLIGYDDDETALGGDGDDTILAAGGHDSLGGGDGDDLIEGGSGDDTIDGDDFGDPGDDTLIGGGGDDVIEDDSRGNSIDGGAGDDTFTGIGGTVLGGSGNDSLRGLGILDGGDGDDTLSAGSVFTNSNDDLTGGAGNDYLEGHDGNDSLEGGDDEDTLLGGEKADTLWGGRGSDLLDGGESVLDVFVYRDVEDSTATATDLIATLNNSKTVDLSAIDANALIGGDQAFDLVPDFTGEAGELRLRYDSALDLTFIEGDVDGDMIADLVISTNKDKTDFTSFEL